MILVSNKSTASVVLSLQERHSLRFNANKEFRTREKVANHSIKTAQNIEEAFKISPTHTQINTSEDPS